MLFFVSRTKFHQPTTSTNGSASRTLPPSTTGGTNGVVLAATANPPGTPSPAQPFPDGFLPDVVRNLFEKGWTRQPIGDNTVIWVRSPDGGSPSPPA